MPTNSYDPALSPEMNSGLSKRELFALVFMAVLMSRPNCPNTVTAAGIAVAAANDLIAELNGWKRAEAES